MEYRKLANTDLELSVITFGSWAAGGWMWGSTPRNNAVEAIKASYELGVTSIDTAPIYGQGTSEEIVGEAIKDIPRDKVQILTKFGMRWDLKKGDFAMKIKECEDSLRRLGTDYIDLYQIHWPDSTTAMHETFEAVHQLIKQGKVRYAGVCNYDVAHLKEAARTLPIVSDQIPFSMVNRGIEEEIVPYCVKHNKSVIVYSPLERGLLTGKIKPGHKFAAGDHRASNPFFSDESIRKTDALLERLRPLAEKKNATLGQLVLRWTIDHPGITIALVGARDAEQAVQNAKAVNVKLSPEEIAFIDKELKK